MDLSSRFKKDYLNYLVSIIIPAFITAFSIPLFKRILGAEGYGHFSLTYNSALLFTALLTGWITQSSIRYFPVMPDKRAFINQSLTLSFITQLLFFLPAVIFGYYRTKDLFFGFFFAFTLFITSMQFSILAISQSVFLSRKNIYSELIRTISYLLIAVCLLNISHVQYMYDLFTAIFVSYLLSFIYLYLQTSRMVPSKETEPVTKSTLTPVVKKFVAYGGPLSIWFVFTYLISLVDKYFMLALVGKEAQGNYQAMFDFLSKSITVLISPVVISLFPLLTAAYQNGEKKEIKKLLLSIIGFEIAGFILAEILFWWFGANILFMLIKIPNTPEYKLMGMVIIAGTFMWQMAMVVHKRQELSFKTRYLLGMIALAFLSQLALYLTFNKDTAPIWYPVGYAGSSLVYLVLVSGGLLRSFFAEKRFRNNPA